MKKTDLRNGFLWLIRKLLGETRYLDWRNEAIQNDLQSPFLLGDDQPVNLPPIPTTTIRQPSPVIHCISPTQRSGSHYLENLLRFHPGLAFPEKSNEPHEYFLHTAGNLLVKYGTYTAGLWKEWITEEENQRSGAERLLGSIGEGILGYIREKNDERPIVLRTPDGHGIEHIFLLFQGSRIVLLIRDGRDTAESFMRSWGSESIFENFCERWATRVTDMLDFYEKVKESEWKDRIYLVRYEELFTHPRDTLTTLLQFLGVDTDMFPFDEITGLPLQGSSTQRGDRKEVHWENVERPPDFQPAGRWRHWTDEKKKKFKNKAGHALIRLGYEKDLQW